MLSPRIRKVIKALKCLSAYELAQLEREVPGFGAAVLTALTRLEQQQQTQPVFLGLTRLEYDMLKENKRINTIKCVRERSGLSLADAKKVVDDASNKMALGELPRAI